MIYKTSHFYAQEISAAFNFHRIIGRSAIFDVEIGIGIMQNRISFKLIILQ